MGKSNLLSTRTVNFGELMGNGKRYRVPPFQRDYSWQEEQWEDLWNDLLDLRIDPDSSHYMGAIVVEAKSDREYLVIDGQQRIATLSILAIAVLDALKTLESNGIDAKKNRERVEVLRVRFVGDKDPASLNYASKLAMNAADDDFYQDFLVNTQTPPNLRRLPSSQRLLWEAFLYFRRRIQQDPALATFGEALATMLDSHVARQLLFIQIAVDDETNAYTVFETLNARGLELTSTDLLKNYLFSRVSSSNDVAAMARKWQRVIEPVDQRNFPEFLRYYLMFRHAKVRQQRLFQTVRKEVPDAASAFRLLDELHRFAHVYSALRDSSHEHWDDRPECKVFVRALKLFRVHQPFPVLMAGFEYLVPAEFQRLMKLIVAISYRYTVICGLNTNDLEPAYHAAAKGIVEGTSTTAGQAYQSMREIYVADEKFFQDFALKRLNASGAQKKIAKYTLCMLESEVSRAHLDFETDNGTIEHILPKNPDDTWLEDFPAERQQSFVDRIGNLALLEPSRNRDVGNADFPTKCHAYKESGYHLTRDVVCDAWSVPQIEERQKRMAKVALRVWRSDFEA